MHLVCEGDLRPVLRTTVVCLHSIVDTVCQRLMQTHREYEAPTDTACPSLHTRNLAACATSPSDQRVAEFCQAVQPILERFDAIRMQLMTWIQAPRAVRTVLCNPR